LLSAHLTTGSARRNRRPNTPLAVPQSDRRRTPSRRPQPTSRSTRRIRGRGRQNPLCPPEINPEYRLKKSEPIRLAVVRRYR
jgi:hypothetical protein